MFFIWAPFNTEGEDLHSQKKKYPNNLFFIEIGDKWLYLTAEVSLAVLSAINSPTASSLLSSIPYESKRN